MTTHSAPLDLLADPFSERAVAVRDARRWFMLAVGALAMSGLFSSVLVFGRMPIFAALMPDAEFARRSLVVHVNLAMGVWFFSVVAGLFCLLPGARRVRTTPTATVLATLGVVGFTIPMFFRSATPILSNYVPMLEHGLFLGGLAVFAVGTVLNFVDPRLLATATPMDDAPALIPADAQHGLRAAALAFGLALLTIAGAYVAQSSATMDPLTYYERLFWGGGHVLQVVNTLGMLAAWLILLHQLTGRLTVPPALAYLLFAVMLLPPMFGPWLAMSGQSGRWFTRMMQYGLFPVALIVLGFGLAALGRHRKRLSPGTFTSPAFVGLATSVAMTLAGFVLGAMITANTTLIPAHYHANIGGVTVAYMAVLVALLPRLGAAIPWPRLAAWQPLVYGVGQMGFAFGLAIAGTLGQAARKTYGAEQQVDASAEWVGLLIAGVGGAVALAGGILFIAIMVAAARQAVRRSGPEA